jgi:hypothetical protein
MVRKEQEEKKAKEQAKIELQKAHDEKIKAEREARLAKDEHLKKIALEHA